MQNQYTFYQQCIHKAANEVLRQQDEIREKTNETWANALENIVEEKKRHRESNRSK